MTIKEIEKKLTDYIEDETVYNHRENALKELEKLRETHILDEMSHICFIISDYPEYDHCLIRIKNEDAFIEMGLSKKYLKSLNKKELHEVAQSIKAFQTKLGQ